MIKEISSPQHPLIKHWTKLRSDASFRKSEKSVLLEGKNCIYDIAKKHPIKRLIVSNKDFALKDVETYLISESLLKKISGVLSPEGILAELDMPKESDLAGAKKIVVSDRIQDPGNLGTLIRSCLAFGWDGIFLLPGSVDPYNDKALRAAKGATFSVPLASGSWEKLQEIVQRNNLKLVVADTAGDEPSCCTNIALVLGNEAQGVQPPSNISFERVTLAMKSDIESLNVAVAGSILLYLYRNVS